MGVGVRVVVVELAVDFDVAGDVDMDSLPSMRVHYSILVGIAARTS